VLFQFRMPRVLGLLHSLPVDDLVCVDLWVAARASPQGASRGTSYGRRRNRRRRSAVGHGARSRSRCEVDTKRRSGVTPVLEVATRSSCPNTRPANHRVCGRHVIGTELAHTRLGGYPRFVFR
jgi:hypothetical protein